MNHKYALLFSFLITGLIASNIFFFHTLSAEDSRESAVISRVIDGDTIKLQDGRTLRFLNINSPEKTDINSALSSEFLKPYENKTVFIEVAGVDKYRRTLARIYDGDEYLNLRLVQLGLASKFLVDSSELSLFSKAESEAVSEGAGIWKKSAYFGCFGAKIDAEGEDVELKNSGCGPVPLKEFYLKDESRKIYKFGDITIPAGESIILHTENGESTETDLFWNSKTSIWNNDRDTLYLFDSEGKIALHSSYGY